ncbi:MAG: hypothetical protein P4L87_21340 [Formivibrio sp.]|nr:hypothetical protein [Formivibrio sp.]
MTKQTNGGSPDLIVLGLGEQGKPQAARFPASQSDPVTKAAKAMNLVVGKADGTALAELADKLPTGRLYATGRGFVPPVKRGLYDKIVEQLKLGGQPVPEPTDVSVPAAPGLPASWDKIEVGQMVIAAEGQPWYAAIVVARDGDMLTLKWRDYPQEPNAIRHVGAVALLKPTPVST